MLKKISWVITFVLLLTMLSGPSIYALPKDMNNSKYKEAVQTLMSLNIMNGYPDNKFYPLNRITRSEFAVVLAKIMGADGINAEKTTKYKDIPEDYWAYDSIMMMTKLNLLNGYENGNFGPNDSVLFEHVVKAIVNACGYNLYAEEHGGYPTGYLYTASDIGLLKNIDCQAGDEITRGEFAQIIYNALDVDMMQRKKYGDELKYEVIKDKTLLTEKMKLIKETGIVTANGKTGLNGESTLKRDEVEINAKVFKLGNTEADKYLGYSITYYYLDSEFNQESNDDVLKYVVADEKKNNTLTLDVNEVTLRNVTLTKLEYQNEQGDNKEVKISQYADYIKNGKSDLTYSPSDLMNLKSGSVTLLSNDGGSNYNIVMITEYDNYVVSSVDLDGHKVYDKYKQEPLVLDFEDQDSYITLKDKDGFDLKLENLKEWYVINVIKSKDGKVVTAAVTNDKVYGDITELSQTNEDTLVTIEGVSYKVAPSYIDSDSPDVAALDVDTKGTFYINALGEIAGVDAEGADKANYAYAANCELKKGLENDQAKMKLFQPDGNMVVLETAKKIKINGDVSDSQGKRYTGGDVRTNALFQNPINKGFIPQLITYRLNSAGQIAEINTAGHNGFAREDTTLTQNITYKKGSGSFGSKYIFTSSTIIFSVPDANANGYIEEKDMDILTKDDFMDETKYSFEAYNVSDTKEIGVIVIKPISGDSSIERDIFLVNGITTALNSNGENAQKISGLYKGKEVAYLCTEESIAAGVRRGDIISIKLTPKNEIEELVSVFSAYNPITFNEAQVLSSASATSSEFLKVCGNVYTKSPNAFTLKIGNVRTDYAYPVDNRTNVYIYDRKKDNNVFRLGNYNDFFADKTGNNGSLIFVHKSYYLVKNIVVIKN